MCTILFHTVTAAFISISSAFSGSEILVSDIFFANGHLVRFSLFKPSLKRGHDYKAQSWALSLFLLVLFMGLKTTDKLWAVISWRKYSNQNDI